MSTATDPGYIAHKPMTIHGRRIMPGQPVPPFGVTHSLRALQWVRLATPSEWEEATAAHGFPPEESSPKGWDYTDKPAAPRRATKKKAAKKKAAKRARRR